MHSAAGNKTMWREFRAGVCWYPDQWDQSLHASDVQRIKAAGFDYVRIAEGAWGVIEPREGEFDFAMFDRAIALCRAAGMSVIMGTPTYCAPAWVSHNYPEVLRWNFERISMTHGSRRIYNYTAPKYLELSDRICAAMAEHYRDEPSIIAWQLDNEFNCHMDVSYAPSDTLAFRRWLREKYGSLEALNFAWGTKFWSQQYDDWNQIDLPHPTAAYLNPHLLLDETRFISDCVLRFARRQADILRAAQPKWQITHNGLFANIDPPGLARQLDFFSHDQYPLFNTHWTSSAIALAQARSLSFPFGILEQQSGPGGQMNYLQRTPRPGELRLWTWQSVTHGARLLGYFRWRTIPFGSEQHWHGLLDADNRDNRRLAEAKATVAELKALPTALLDAPPLQRVAMLRDFDNETNCRRINSYAPQTGGESNRWCGALLRRHVPMDQVWTDGNFDEYALLIATGLRIVDPSLVEKLTRFVQRGGVLALGCQSGTKDRNLHMISTTPPGLLAPLAGVEVDDWTIIDPKEQRTATLIENGRALTFCGFAETLRPSTATALAQWTDDLLLGGKPALTRNLPFKNSGGAVYYLGGSVTEASIPTLLDLLATDPKLAPGTLEPLADAPEQVEIVGSGEAMQYLAILNHGDTPAVVGKLGKRRNLLDGGRAVNDTIELPPFGVAILEK